MLESVGVGSIVGAVRSQDGESKRVLFKDVLIVPELKQNLLSVKKIASGGGKITFSSSDMNIDMHGVQLPMRVVGGLYTLGYRCLNESGERLTEQQADAMKESASVGDRRRADKQEEHKWETAIWEGSGCTRRQGKQQQQWYSGRAQQSDHGTRARHAA